MISCQWIEGKGGRLQPYRDALQHTLPAICQNVLLGFAKYSAFLRDTSPGQVPRIKV